MDGDLCCVCLKLPRVPKNIHETDAENQSYADKLQTCVPEIVYRKKKYSICERCCKRLDNAYDFREACLRAERLRSEPIKEEIQHEIVPDEAAQNNTESKKRLRFACEDCSEVFKVAKKFTEHTLETHGKAVKPFCCEMCCARFSTSSNLIQHLQYHNGDRSHICSYCGKGFKAKSDVRTHEKLHLNKREYKCETCAKTFNTHKDLRSHNLVVHTDPGQWKHVCDICGKRFPIKSNYDGHMRRHSGIRTFGCHLCDKKFVDKCVMQKHLRTHTNIREFKCEMCEKLYKDKRVLDIHRTKVHEMGDTKIPVRLKKHGCHLCPKAFVDRTKLTRHLYIHTGEKPFSCELCEKRFTDKSYLTQHVKKFHNFNTKAEKGDFLLIS